MANIYLHPFIDHTHYVGVGDKSLFTLDARVSLRGISPTFGRAQYKYLGTMGANSDTFANYGGVADRIYVLGHCSPGSSNLTTETVRGGVCSADALADIFVAHGLPKDSQAHIRIHACHSGSDGVMNASFAGQFFGRMFDRQYCNLKVRGYTVGVGPFFIKRLGTGGSINKHAVDYTLRPKDPPVLVGDTI